MACASSTSSGAALAVRAAARLGPGGHHRRAAAAAAAISFSSNRVLDCRPPDCHARLMQPFGGSPRTVVTKTTRGVGRADSGLSSPTKNTFVRGAPSLALSSSSSSLLTGSPTTTLEPCLRRYYSCTTRTLLSSSSGNTVPANAPVTSIDGVTASHPIDFDVSSSISGNESQIVTIDIEPGQVLRAESGAMMYMTSGVTMETTTGGGMSAGFQRMLTGQNVFISDYRYDGERGTVGTVALGTDFPSKIVRLNVDEWGGKLVCQKGALLCCSHTINVEMEFTKKFSTGFFGGEGFILQALTGHGDCFVKAGGTLIRRELDDGENLRISSGCLVAFSQDVQYDIEMMPGFKNVLFGGEGLFVTTLKGPGTVWLQGMPPQRMISEIARRVPRGGGIGLAVPVPGMGGGGEDGGGGGEEGGGEGEGK